MAIEIFQQPDSLSLSGNMKEIVLTGVTDTEVLFQLFVPASEDPVLERIYAPDASGKITIDIHRFLEDRQAFVLDGTTTEPYQQETLACTYYFMVNEDEDLVSDEFTVIRGGVANLADTAADWLEQNFLTWQPTVKRVTYSTPEALTYYAQRDCCLIIKVYYPDGSSEQLDPVELSAGAWTIPVSYAVVAAMVDELPGAYDVWIAEETDGEEDLQRLTYVQRYLADGMREDEQWILFENSLGGVDCLRAYGKGTLETEHEHQIAETEDTLNEYRVDTKRTFRKSTGWMDKQQRRWMLDFFPSRQRWIFQDNALLPIVLTEDTATYTIDNMPAEFEFKFRYASATPYLNIPRADVPAAVMNITAPDMRSFTIPPRLVEFPRINPSEGGLIPIQHPYSETWSTLSLAELLSLVAGDIHGAIEIVSDKFIVDSNYYLLYKQVISGITTFHKIYAKGADLWSSHAFQDWLDQPVRTDDDVTHKSVTATERITASQDLYVGDFEPGLLGHGTHLSQNGEGELDSLTLRKWLEVPELRYNRVSVYIGVRWDTFGGGIIESVTPNPAGAWTGTGKLKLDAGEIGAIAVGDLCMGIWHDETGNDTENSDDNRGNFTFAGFKTVYFVITGVSGTHNENFTYTLRSQAEGGNGVHPFAQMHFAGRGSTSDTSRQAFTYTTTEYSLSLKGVDTWEFQPTNYYEIRGHIEGFSMPAIDHEGHPYTKVFHGYGQVFGNAYVFGDIDQFERAGYTMLIDQSLNGSLAPGETEQVTIKILDGYGLDCTTQFSQISVTRDTGDAASDAIWNARHTQVDNPFDISFSDLGIDGINRMLAVFHVVATDEADDMSVSGNMDFFS